MSDAVFLWQAFELIFGVFYLIFGRGPQIKGVPRWFMAFCRLAFPFPLLAFAIYQSEFEKGRP